MTIIANKIMQNLVSEEQLVILQNQTITCAEIDVLMASPVVEIDNCFFIKALYGEESSPHGLLPKMDKTGIECFINHVHAEDFIKTEPQISDLMAHGFRLFFGFYDKLDDYESDKTFCVIITFNESTCTVRFHAVRENEQWLTDNLEDYTLDAVAKVYTLRD
jgi:hypothetical protein